MEWSTAHIIKSVGTMNNHPLLAVSFAIVKTETAVAKYSVTSLEKKQN